MSSFLWELRGTLHSTRWTHYLWVHFFGNSMEHFIPQGEHTICEFISLGTPWNIWFHKVNTLFVSSFLCELHGTFHSTKWTHYLWVHFFGNSVEHLIPQGEHTICEFIFLGIPWNVSFHQVNTLFVSSFFGELHGTFHSTRWTHYLWVHFLGNSVEHFFVNSLILKLEKAWR